jgi:hypothetical protein
MVELFRLNLIDQFGKTTGIGEIAVMEKKTGSHDVRILIKMVNPMGVEAGGAADNPVNFISFFQK